MAFDSLVSSFQILPVSLCRFVLASELLLFLFLFLFDISIHASMATLETLSQTPAPKLKFFQSPFRTVDSENEDLWGRSASKSKPQEQLIVQYPNEWGEEPYLSEMSKLASSRFSMIC